MDDILDHIRQEHSIFIHDAEALSMPLEFLPALVELANDELCGNQDDFGTTHVVSTDPHVIAALEACLESYRASALDAQEAERTQPLKPSKCVMCTEPLSTDKTAALEHLLDVHGLRCGQPNNLVFVEDMFDLIRGVTMDKVCIYCNGQFQNNQSLRSHLRKKRHARLHPSDSRFDRFYMKNYLTALAPPPETGYRSPEPLPDSSEDEYEEPSLPGPAVPCFICEAAVGSVSALDGHCLSEHGVDLSRWRAAVAALGTYDRISFINHLRTTHCSELPDATDYTGPNQSLLPVLEDDPLLMDSAWVHEPEAEED
ncbi:C2H2 type zinc-finger (2 copies) [Carpediemonas membranifera]|uniref:C2H2 type zinc-finger (2 copies) n=1 Tax=Carpediemonas membranifera TaxID=201153 RepID=A0A8J6B7F1_9EUKA|nr:C2H2 type zinc-finger (2 copies) [Carpediemonas membranifera]|eukprot:KAG9394679.1 C2H2 type zinc-finger (2 copies) [Carpediemonas membranifera]